ncbi:hypothetical protein K504DRAFT_470057 [Pleomassaria siparia CBS 279.74]|uniref:Cell wall protein YJL171C/Tos1 C-terminal domain-containing protein n=1 Tax=Pleomassaria siparia CBS 279.74 TaxID=1314801 RepID=A0A6G1K462_9PLEO|nr:hypothetical protein K504DRAFT_470057 [Pleomassaria siparia CBS 279.74]
MHLRGPMNVSQIAVYTFPDVTAYTDQDVGNDMHQGQTNEPQSSSEPPLPPMPLYRKCQTTFETRVANATASPTPFPDPEPTMASTPEKDVSIAAASSWSRVAYYTSTAPAAATGIAFLANLGDPQKSGTFDYSFGNSLSYVSEDGRKVVSQTTAFDGTLATSEIEITAFTDQQCGVNCEYSRPMSTAYRGWTGENKIFMIEFQMDHYDNIGNDQGMLSDAPAWWFLNAAIPRVLQYGNDRANIPCSCWSTGCGEFDAFEVLGRGEERAKSTIHRPGNLEGGDSNYFRRPVGRTLKFAVVLYQFNITATVLGDEFVFGKSLSMDQVKSVVQYDPDSSTHSLFAIGT